MCTGASEPERPGTDRVLELLFVHCREISLFAWALNPLKNPAALELHSNLRTLLGNKSCSFAI